MLVVILDKMEEEKILPICQYPFCRKIRIRDDPVLWLDKGEEPFLYNLFMYGKKLSHGICPSCFKRGMRKLEEDISKGIIK